MLLRARLADLLIEGVVECAGQVQSLDNVGPIEAEIEKVGILGLSPPERFAGTGVDQLGPEKQLVGDDGHQPVEFRLMPG